MTNSDIEKIFFGIMKLFGPKATEEEVISFLAAILVGKAIHLSSTKHEAVERIADMSAKALIMIQSYQSSGICHWRSDGESVQ